MGFFFTHISFRGVAELLLNYYSAKEVGKWLHSSRNVFSLKQGALLHSKPAWGPTGP